MLENKVKDIIDRLREVSKIKTIVLLDYDTNADVDNGRKPLSGEIGASPPTWRR